mmetsp:Transcript_20734/g.30683  ORF Transcript_20734/g.30683 Transcript_20734/m.30683 type:complete len:126 (+) Transcript_20734:84-461(+)|eukprot:CAMPEP_0171453662 /NCGR_PEP_ID=MMETSP0945-20130129/1274_1 /TAXON_ID=109269 /ORGANISM="Vaucheria litorea, Strain CCMP2940" /LENGTH=125 /DNA_ID=CAMNT_0011978561 /DNA_START=69 /DNA_END=446 /DNA_ORIENTATION=+
MSWDAYVTSLLQRHCSQAAIVGQGGGVWAASPGFAVSEAEISAINRGWSDPGTHFAPSGIVIGGRKFKFIRGDDQVVMVKDGASGACLRKTKQAIIIGVYDDKSQPGENSVGVNSIADHLADSGY